MPRISAPSIAEHRAERHSRILDAADRLLRDGQECSMANVARESGLPRSTVYEYFPSASDLAQQARRHRDLPIYLVLGRAFDVGAASQQSIDELADLLQARGCAESTATAIHLLSMMVRPTQGQASPHVEQQRALALRLAAGACLAAIEPHLSDLSTMDAALPTMEDDT